MLFVAFELVTDEAAASSSLQRVERGYLTARSSKLPV